MRVFAVVFSLILWSDLSQEHSQFVCLLVVGAFWVGGSFLEEKLSVAKR